jgi:hypothetical protein
VYSSSTVDVAAHCSTNVIMQATNLAISQVSSDSRNSLTLIHWFTVWGKIIIFVGDEEIKACIITVNFVTVGIC